MSKYRLNFSKNFSDELKIFSELNKNLDVIDFKLRMDRWVVNNNSLVEKEMEFLNSSGYDGNILQKIFKSARYYFSKLNEKKVEKKERKKYSTKDNELLERIKKHIEIKKMEKPSIAYSNFYEVNKDYLDKYVEKLVYNGYNKRGANEKLKKIYKNKFYILSKK